MPRYGYQESVDLPLQTRIEEGPLPDLLRSGDGVDRLLYLSQLAPPNPDSVMKIRCKRAVEVLGELPLLSWTDSGSLPDLRTRVTTTLKAGSTAVVPLNVIVEIPPDHFGVLLLRSSLAVKGLLLTGGLIDNSYRWASSSLVFAVFF